MASIAKKHAYRFGYLKSEQWQNVRAAVLARDQAKCLICRHKDISNDVHHCVYPESVWDTKPDDCITLCRFCHNKMHELINEKTTWGEIVKLTLIRIFAKLLFDLSVARKRNYRKTTFCRICGCEKCITVPRLVVPHSEKLLPVCDSCWCQVVNIPEPRTWSKVGKLRKNFN